MNISPRDWQHTLDDTRTKFDKTMNEVERQNAIMREGGWHVVKERAYYYQAGSCETQGYVVHFSLARPLAIITTGDKSPRKQIFKIREYFLDIRKPTECERALWETELGFAFVSQENLDEMLACVPNSQLIE